MRASGVYGLLIYCADYRCSQSTPIHDFFDRGRVMSAFGKRRDRGIDQ
jgi:hypothetical protein